MATLVALFSVFTGSAMAQTPPEGVATKPAVQSALMNISDADILGVLSTLKPTSGELKVIQEKDEDGLTAFYATVGENLLFSLYQYADESGKVTSFGLTFGFTVGRAVDPRVINTWNSRQRFTKAFWDSVGDPMLSADLNVTSGVTRGAFSDWLKMFMQATQDYEKHVKTG